MNFHFCLIALVGTLMASCESRPIHSETTTDKDLPASGRLIPSSVSPAAGSLPVDTLLTAARRAVLRQATPPADTSAPFLPKSGERRSLPTRLPRDFRYNRRYVGTLGGQPVVLELTGYPGVPYVGGDEQPCYVGRYYFGWGGEERTVSSAGYRTDQPLLLVERIILNGPEEAPDGLYAEESPSTGIWQAQQQLGPILTGTWTDKATRRTTRFKLHEDYAGAVRYEDRETRMQAKKTCRVPNHQSPGTYEDYQRTAIWWGAHLLGPDTLRPAWRQLQCPVPQQVQQQLAALLAQTDCAGHVRCREKSRLIIYNEDNLLSYTDVWSTITAAFQPSQHVEEHTYDLATGKECCIVDWLRPDKLDEVQLLAVQYYNRARHYPAPPPGAVSRWPAKLPVFLLSSAGIAFRFPAGGNDSQKYSLLQHQPVTIPFAALAPYVRPGTPLARLVTVRTQHQ